MGKSAVKGTGYLEGFSLHTAHEQSFWERTSFGVLLDYVSGCDHPLDFSVRDSTSAHALLGMGGDEIAVLGNCPAQGRDIKRGHANTSRTRAVLVSVPGGRNSSSRFQHGKARSFGPMKTASIPAPRGSARRSAPPCGYATALLRMHRWSSRRGCPRPGACSSVCVSMGSGEERTLWRPGLGRADAL